MPDKLWIDDFIWWKSIPGFHKLRLIQNGLHFAEDILSAFSWIKICEFRLQFHGNLYRPGTKPLSEPMMMRLSSDICVIRPQWVKCDMQTCMIWWHECSLFPVAVDYLLKMQLWHEMVYISYHKQICTRLAMRCYIVVIVWVSIRFMLSIESYIDGFVQDCSYSSMFAMELLQSCTKLSIYYSGLFLDGIIDCLSITVLRWWSN